MPISQHRNAISSVATTAVLCYTFLGAPAINPVNYSNLHTAIRAPEEMSFQSYYELIDRDQSVAMNQIEIIHKFSSYILENIEDLDPEFSKTIDEDFWDLV